jgi:hypothetical protein
MGYEDADQAESRNGKNMNEFLSTLTSAVQYLQ